MKKAFAILIALIMLASVIQVSIDHHYCGGKLSGIKISIMGKMASCGMENDIHPCTNQNVIDKKCCEDQLTYYSFSSKYLPEHFRITQTYAGKDVPAFPVFNIVISSPDISGFTSMVLPPGDKIKSDVTLSEICVFRI